MTKTPTSFCAKSRLEIRKWPEVGASWKSTQSRVCRMPAMRSKSGNSSLRYLGYAIFVVSLCLTMLHVHACTYPMRLRVKDGTKHSMCLRACRCG